MPGTIDQRTDPSVSKNGQRSIYTGYSNPVKDYRSFYVVFTCQKVDIIVLTMDEQRRNQAALGNRIKHFRRKLGWTQERLGESADVNPKYLGELERGRQNPSFLFLTKISAALNVDISELTRIEEEAISRNEVETRLYEKIKSLSDDEARKLLTILNMLFPLDK